MRRYALSLSVFLLPFLLFACAQGGPSVLQEELPEVIEELVEEEEESMLEEEDLVTRNVTYTGILEEGGVTIYQEGSHRLMLNDGKMVLLEPIEDGPIALSLYVGKLVKVRGDVMPTVEAGGTLMNVKKIVWIKREENEEVLLELCGGEEGAGCFDDDVCVLTEGEEMGVCEEGEDDEEDEEEPDEEDDEEDEDEEDENEEDDEEDEEESDEEDDDEGGDEDDGEDDEEDEDEDEDEDDGEDEPPLTLSQQETITLMEEEDYAASRWTQEYCSTHVGFCVSVHKNWYFKSFGATASLLWHIEMGASLVDGFGDGPLTVDLKTGSLEALGVSNAQVREIGSKVIGYRSWSDNRHFEISAPLSLREPVEFVTNELRGPE